MSLWNYDPNDVAEYGCKMCGHPANTTMPPLSAGDKRHRSRALGIEQSKTITITLPGAVCDWFIKEENDAGDTLENVLTRLIIDEYLFSKRNRLLSELQALQMDFALLQEMQTTGEPVK